MRTVLFGFTPERCERFFIGELSKRGGKIGGSLLLQTYEGQFLARRYAKELNPLGEPGDLKVTAPNGERMGSHRLSALLSGIDERVYHNVFTVGMAEIQQLGSLTDTQASQYLYNLSTGTDQVSLVDVMRQLKMARQQLVGTEGQPGVLANLLAQRERLGQQIQKLGNLTDRWSHLKSEADSVDTEVRRLETKRDRLQSEGKRRRAGSARAT